MAGRLVDKSVSYYVLSPSFVQSFSEASTVVIGAVCVSFEVFKGLYHMHADIVEFDVCGCETSARHENPSRDFRKLQTPDTFSEIFGERLHVLGPPVRNNDI
jgi:hypothetical protein